LIKFDLDNSVLGSFWEEKGIALRILLSVKLDFSIPFLCIFPF